MFSGKCMNGMKLCPVSFGIALGLSCGLAVMLWSLWVMMYGMPASAMGHMVPPATMGEMFGCAGWCLVKGFFFGFVFALLYDLCACCMAKCCKKSSGSCGCGCGCASCGGKTK